MAAENATVHAVKGQALRVYGWINDSTTGNALDISSGGVTMAANISKDGADGASSVATPQKVTNQTGRFYLELNATEMDAYNLGVVVSCNASNQMESKIDVLCDLLTEPTGHIRAGTILRREQFIVQTHMYFFNKVSRVISTGTISVWNYGKSLVLTTLGRITGDDLLGKDQAA